MRVSSDPCIAAYQSVLRVSRNRRFSQSRVRRGDCPTQLNCTLLIVLITHTSKAMVGRLIYRYEDVWLCLHALSIDREIQFSASDLCVEVCLATDRPSSQRAFPASE